VSCDEEMKDLNTIFSNPTVLPGSLIILGPGTLQVPVQCRTFCPHPGKACLRLSSSAGCWVCACATAICVTCSLHCDVRLQIPKGGLQVARIPA
jgi:hypothetical protein